MRKSNLFLAAAVLALAIPAQAKMPYVAAAKAAGIDSVKNCATCHVGAAKKGGDLTDMGKWLVAQKATRKAAEVDVKWLKDYKGK